MSTNNSNNNQPFDGDDWNEMSPVRSPFETDEDYEERQADLYGEDWRD